ncbi:MAG: AAA family ATPase [Bergeyella sp.]
MIHFSPVTVFYGNNGSGKSTLLNVIAEKIKIKHKTLGNSSFYFNEFVEKCSFQTAERNGKEIKIPKESRFIRSEDIAEAIVNLRSKTEKAEKRILEANEKDDRARMFAWQNHNELSEQFSNGETAISYFENIFEPDTLYLLDEPENSFSPKLQLVVKKLIEKYSHLYNCQFIIASHSPFVLAIENAKIYNLDSNPAKECNWQELENMKLLYELFRNNKKYFE